MTFQLVIFPNPSSINVKFSVHKKPVFATLIQTPGSGREVTRFQQSSPFWEYELQFEILRDQSQNSAVFQAVSGFQEMQTLSAFWLSRNGQYGAFLYSDPDDNSRTGQIIATANGVLTSFPIVRTFGVGTYAFNEQVGIVDVRTGATLNVYLNGVLLAQSGNWWIDTDLRTLRFVTPPANGVVITMDFSFFYFCRFIEDKLDLEEFMTGRWSVKSLKFRSTMPDPPTSGNPYTIPNQNTTLTTPPSTGPGKYYFEITVNAASTASETSVLIGIANATFNLTKPIPLDFTSGTWSPQLDGGLFYKCSNTLGTAWAGGTANPNNLPFSTNYVGRAIGVAVDTGNHLIWTRDTTNPTVWYAGGPGSPDPATGLYGFDFHNCAIGNSDLIYILCGCSQPGNSGVAIACQLTLNVGGSAFAATAPTGFTAWGTTTINPSDKGNDLNLSNGNLTLTAGVITGTNQPCEFARSGTSKRQV